MSAPDLRPLARATAELSAAQAVGIVARLAWVALAARLLGPERYAQLAWAQAWYLAFLPVALFGLGPALVWHLARDAARTPELAATALALRLAMTAVALAACLALAPLAAPDPGALVLVAVLLVALAGRAVAAWSQHLFVARNLNRHTLAQETAFRVAEVAAAIAVLLAGGGLLALVVVHAVAWAAQAARSLRVVAARIVPPRATWSPPAARALAATAAPFFALQLLAEWRVQGPLLLFAGVAAGGAALGQFALAMQAMLIATLVPQALGAAAQPALVRAASRGDGQDLRYADLLQRLGFTAGAAAGLAGLALGEPLFIAVFGVDYAAAGRLTGLTLWCLVPLTAGFAWPAVFAARGELRGQVVQSAVATALLVLLLPPLATALGATGAVLAAGLAYALPPLLATLVAVRRGWTGAGEALLRPSAAVLAGLAAWFAAAPAGPWLALPAALATLGTATALLGVLGRADLVTLRGLAAR